MVEFSGAGRPLSTEIARDGPNELGVVPAAFWAVMEVETRGFGFLPDRRPVILFERHIFHRETGGRFSAAHPDISNPVPRGYGKGGAHQYERLAKAAGLDRSAALKSASWGLGQVMGFNAAPAGFADEEEMVSRMAESEDQQALGLVRFIVKNDLARHLRDKNWAAFARGYNGSGFKKWQYDLKLERAFNLYSVNPLPDLDVRSAQAALMYLGFDPAGIDGVFGQRTQAALMRWQRKNGIAADGALSPDMVDRLKAQAFGP